MSILREFLRFFRFRPAWCPVVLVGLTVLASLPATEEKDPPSLQASLGALHELAAAREAGWVEAGGQRWTLVFRDGIPVRLRKVSGGDGRTRQDLTWSAARVGKRWFGHELRAPVPPLLHLLDGDGSALTSTPAGGLRGTLHLEIQRGDWKENMEAYTTNFQGVAKSGSIPVMDWAVGIHRQEPGRQAFTVEADPLPGGVFLTGRLVGGLPGGQDVHFSSVSAPGVGVLSGRATAPRWNRAAHRVAGADLVLEDGRLTGELVIAYHRDSWVPRQLPAAGFCTRRYRIDLPVDGDRIVGAVTVTGDLGQGRCHLEATALRAVSGSYRAEGVDGAYEGALYGGVAPLRDGLPAPVADADPARRWQELAVALRCLRREAGLGPTPPGQELSGRITPRFAHWAAANLAAARAGHRPLAGVDPMLDPAFGPFYGGDLVLEEMDGRYRIPATTVAGPQRWAAIPTFTAWGPLEGLDWSYDQHPVLPELDPAAAGGGWTTVRQHGVATVPDGHPLAKRARAVWYARAVLHADAPRDTWLAIMVHEDGVVWHDGVRLWASGPRQGGRETAVVPLSLHAGDNEILVRVGSLVGGGRYSAGKGGPGSLALHCCLGGAPRSALPPPAVRAPTPSDAAPDPFPVLSWDLALGGNVAWRKPLGLKHPPLPVGDAVVVAADALRCLAAADGGERWTVTATGGSWIRPVADDEGVVYAAHTSGVVVAVDPDGSERWRVQVADRAADGSLHLAGTKLLWFQPTGGGGRVVALARADGSPCWTAPMPGAEARHACTVPPRPDEALALVTNGGGAISVADGMRVGDGRVPGHPCPLPPQAHGRRVLLRAGEVGLDLVRDADGRLGMRLAWEVERYQHYGYPDWPAATAMAEDGLLYVLRDAPEHSTHGPLPASHLYQVAADTGHMTGYRKRLLDNALNPSGMSVHGRLLAAVDRGGQVFAGEDKGTQIAIAVSGDPPAILGVSGGLPGGRAPVADGLGGWYLFGGGELVRVALGEGFPRQEMVNRAVRSLLVWDLYPRPEVLPVTTVEPLPARVDPETVPVWPLWPKGSPLGWLAAAERPKGDGAAMPEALAAGPAGWTGLTPVDPGTLMQESRNSFVDGRPAFVPCFSVDPLVLLGRRPHTETHLASVLRVDQHRVMALHANSYGMDVWLGGTKLEHGQLVAFAPGDYALVVRFSLGRVMGFMKRMRATVAFLPAEDPRVAMTTWRDKVRQRRSWLEQLVAIDPESPGAAQARFLLAEIAGDEGK